MKSQWEIGYKHFTIFTKLLSVWVAIFFIFCFIVNTMTVTNDSGMPVINPHMKFKVTETGVIKSPEVYRYSLQRDIENSDNYYRNFLHSVEKRNRAKLRERHPNLTGNLIGIIKACFLVFAACLGLRYRHSVPGIKNMCKPPKTPPPDFKKDFKKLFGIK